MHVLFIYNESSFCQLTDNLFNYESNGVFIFRETFMFLK